MSLGARKLIGVIATVTFLALYALGAMIVGGELVTGSGKLIEFCYFTLAGLAWMPVAMGIIRWMSKEH